MSNIRKLANESQIRRLLGDVDDNLVMAVLDTGASYEDVLAAAYGLDPDDVKLPGDFPVLSRKAQHICDLLVSRRNPLPQDERTGEIP